MKKKNTLFIQYAVITLLVLLSSCSSQNEEQQTKVAASSETQNSAIKQEHRHNEYQNPAQAQKLGDEQTLGKPGIEFTDEKNSLDDDLAQSYQDDSDNDDQQFGTINQSVDVTNQPFATNSQPVDIVSFRSDIESGYIEWAPPQELDYKQTDIVISGSNGETVRHSFSSGEPLVLQGSLPDGVYNWESVVTPNIDPYVRQEMNQVRLQGDLQAEQQLTRRLRSQGYLQSEAQSNANRQSGTFTVRDGVATPNYVDDPGSSEPAR